MALAPPPGQPPPLVVAVDAGGTGGATPPEVATDEEHHAAEGGPNAWTLLPGVACPPPSLPARPSFKEGVLRAAAEADIRHSRRSGDLPTEAGADDGSVAGSERGSYLTLAKGNDSVLHTPLSGASGPYRRQMTFDEIVNENHLAQERKEARLYVTLLMPGSMLLTGWRIIMTICVLYVVCITPVELAFSWWHAHAFFYVAGKFVDAACILDMLVNFNAAKLEHGHLITDRCKIATSYLKSWFLVDVLTNFPWDQFFSKQSGQSRKVAKVLKLPKLFRIFRLFRVAQEEAYYFGSIFSVLIIIFVAHYMSCGWAWWLIECDISAPDTDCPSLIAAYFQGLSVGMATIGGSDAWKRFLWQRPVDPADTTARALSSRHFAEEFVWGNQPDAVVELAATVASLTGFCVLAMLFANVALTIGKTGSHAKVFSSRLSNLKAAHVQHNIPDDLLQRVRRHFHYVWSCGSDCSRALLKDKALTVDLRRELAHCFYGHALRKVPFLAEAEEAFLKQLCDRVEMECFSPDDRIIVAGEMGTELYFLVSGRMRIELPDGRGELKKLLEGSFFGEMGLLFPGSPRTVNVVAETFGWVLIIDRQALEEIATDALLDTFRSVAKERHEEMRKSIAPGSGFTLKYDLPSEAASDSGDDKSEEEPRTGKWGESGQGSKDFPSEQESKQSGRGLLPVPSALDKTWKSTASSAPSCSWMSSRSPRPNSARGSNREAAGALSRMRQSKEQATNLQALATAVDALAKQMKEVAADQRGLREAAAKQREGIAELASEFREALAEISKGQRATAERLASMEARWLAARCTGCMEDDFMDGRLRSSTTSTTTEV